MADNVERLLFKLDIEDIGVDKTADDLRRRLALLASTTKLLDREAKALQRTLAKEDQTIDDAVKATRKLNAEQQKSIDIQKDLKRQTEQAARARKDSADTARLAGDVESRTRAITGGIGFVGGGAGQRIEQVANIGAEGLASIEAIGLLKQELPALTTNLVASAGGATAAAVAIGTAAAALAALVIAFKVFQNIVNDSKKATDSLIDVNERYAEIIATSTTDEVNEAIRANKERNEVLRLEREQLRGFIDATEDIDGAAGAFLDLNDALNTNLGGMEDVQNKLDEVNKELSDNVNLNDQLGSALARGATAARDAAAAEAELAKERETEVGKRIAQTRREAEAEADITRKTNTYTEQQRQARLDEIEILIAQEKRIQEINAIDRERGKIEGQAATDEFNNSLARVTQLENERQALDTTVKEAVERREAEAAAIELFNDALKLSEELAEQAAKDLVDGFNALTDNAQKTAQDLQDYADKTAEIEAKRQLDITQASEKAALKRTNDLADHYADLTEIDRDFYEERADLLDDISADLDALDDEKLQALKDFNKTEIRATVDHLKRLEDIRLRAQNSIRSASARLDALGIYEAQKAAEEELKTENDKYSEEKRRREQDFRDQLQQIAKERAETLRAGQQALRDLQQQHARERQSAIAAFNEKLRREDQQAALERNQQQQRWALEDQQRQAQFNKAETQTIMHQENLLSITAAGMTNIETTFENTMTNLTAAAGMKTITPVGSPAANLPTGNLPAYSSAAALTSSAQSLTDYRAPNAPQPSGALAAAGATIMINIDGSRQPIEVGAEVRRELNNVFGGIAVG